MLRTCYKGINWTGVQSIKIKHVVNVSDSLRSYVIGVPFFVLHGKANTVCHTIFSTYALHLDNIPATPDLPSQEGHLRLSIDSSTKRLVFVALSLR